MARKDYTNLTPSQYLTILEYNTYTIGEYTYTVAGQLGSRIYIEIYKDGKKQNLSFSIDPEQIKQQVITDGKKEEKIQLRITRNLKEKLEELAKEKNQSVSDYIRDLIIEKLSQKEQKLTLSQQ